MTDDSLRVPAPWDDEQVASLNGYQFSGVMHPFTCPQPHLWSWDDGLEVHSAFAGHYRSGHMLLVALEDGWHCPNDLCSYTQNWAWTFMVDGSWRAHKAAMDSLLGRS